VLTNATFAIICSEPRRILPEPFPGVVPHRRRLRHILSSHRRLVCGYPPRSLDRQKIAPISIWCDAPKHGRVCDVMYQPCTTVKNATIQAGNAPRSLIRLLSASQTSLKKTPRSLMADACRAITGVVCTVVFGSTLLGCADPFVPETQTANSAALSKAGLPPCDPNVEICIERSEGGSDRTRTR
jgi:hypothetical protein